MVFKAQNMKDCFKYFCLIVFIISLLPACASKKQDSQLLGIQNQITYLTDSYNKLSMNLNEIQDTLLAMQSRMELLKDSEAIVYQKKSVKKKKFRKTAKKGDDKAKKQLKKDKVAKKDEVPVFDLGMSSGGISADPGEVYKLKGGEGYIRIEGTTSTRSTKKVSKAQKIEKKSQPDDLTISPKEFYNAAYKAYSDRNFDKAIKRFDNFLKIFPEHNLSDNAVYWIGESYVGKGDYALALPEFQRISMKYPNGNKVPDSLLMMGICFDKMENKDNALESWKKLVMLFPDTMAAKKAKSKLESYE